MRELKKRRGRSIGVVEELSSYCACKNYNCQASSASSDLYEASKKYAVFGWEPWSVEDNI